MFYLVSVDFKFRCKHQCVHDTGNFIYLFVSPFFFIREHHNPSQSRLLNSLACSNDPCWWKKSNEQQWIIGFIGIFSIKGFTGVVPHQSLQPERCAIFELNLSFPLKKKSKQHFRYPFLIPWKCFMAENHWKSALLNLHFCRKEKYLPISRRSSGSRSGSKLKPPQKVFPQKRKWWELFGRSRVQGTWPSHLFTFHPSKGRPTGPDFNSWYGLVNATPLNPANGTKNRENISRLGKKTW